LQFSTNARNLASMWFSSPKPAPSLTQDLVERTWDIEGRLKQLEDRLTAELDELSKRYRRAEQSEKRLADKRTSSDCEDCDDEPAVHPAIAALKRRQNGTLAARVNSLTG